MREEEIISFEHYYSPDRILVFTKNNKLIELHCPFIVVAKENTNKINKGQRLLVEKTGLTKNEAYVFLINENWYFPKYFSILVY